MEWLVIATAVAGVALLLAARFGSGGRCHGGRRQQSLLSPVTQQHIDLFQGGRLSEAAVETAKARLRGLLGARPGGRRGGQPAAGTAVCRPRAGAGRAGQPARRPILGRQLQRRLSDDPVEQCWYWIDLAHGLRHLGRADCLPHLLRCPATVGEVPLGQFFAAETACCLGFADVLRRPLSPLGRSALRVLHTALRGLRHGVPPQTVGEGRLGEAVARLWRHRPDRADPLVVRVLVECLRLLQRADHAEHALAGNPYGGETLRRQMRRTADAGRRLRRLPVRRRRRLARRPGDCGRRPPARTCSPRWRTCGPTRPRSCCRWCRSWPAVHRPAGVRLLAFARTPAVADGPDRLGAAMGAAGAAGAAAAASRTRRRGRRCRRRLPYAAILHSPPPAPVGRDRSVPARPRPTTGTRRSGPPAVAQPRLVGADRPRRHASPAGPVP